MVHILLSMVSALGVTSGCGVIMVCVCVAGVAGAASGTHKS